MSDLLATLGGLVSALGNVQSAAVLRERLALASDQAALLVAELGDIKAELAQALSERSAAIDEAERLKAKLQALEQRDAANANPKGYRCDGCGGGALRRKGAKPDPVFGSLGAKLALYACDACGAVSEFAEDPS
jgi:hypothetical protein